MKTKITLTHFAIKLHRRLLLALVLALPILSQAAPFGSAFTYQGRLNFSGTPAADGLYDFRFTLHDALTVGSPIGSAVSVNAVPVTNGLFTAQLDFGAPAFTSGEARWLQLQVNTNGATPLAALNPRQRLAPTPQAIYAGNAATASGVAPGAVTSSGLAPGSVNGSAIADGSIGAADLSPGLLNGTFWKLGGNAGAGNFLGSIDNQPVELRVNNQPALRLLPNATSPNLVGGHSANFVNPGGTGAFIGGGGSAVDFNVANGKYATVVGGIQNRAFGDGVFIGGGSSNRVEGDAAFVGGGSRNVAGAPYATVAGGFFNNNFETNGTIGGGSGNTVSGDQAGSTIGGGRNNYLYQSQDGTIAGGLQNHIKGSSPTAAIGGGYQNFIETNGYSGTIAGGYFNLLTAPYANIGGGRFNSAYGVSSTIGGGASNRTTALYSTVPGGWANQAAGDYSLAAGRRAAANQQGTFVWADSTDASFTSTASNQFLIRASGGVGINTNRPQQALHVNGSFALVEGANHEQAYLGGDGGANDVQLGSLNPTVRAVTLWNNVFGLMDLNSANINASGTVSTPNVEVGRQIRVPGAGVGTATPVFIHRTSATSVSGHITTIDHPLCNGDINAILIITHNFTADVAPTRYETQPVGVYYNGSRWTIYHEDNLTAMPVGRAFNVMVIKP